MPVYMNSRKYTGAYMNGHRVNGYINGKKLFDYSVTVTILYENTHSNNAVVGQITTQVKPGTSVSADSLGSNNIPGGYNEDVARTNGNTQTVNSNTTIVFYVWAGDSGGGDIPYTPPTPTHQPTQQTYTWTIDYYDFNTNQLISTETYTGTPGEVFNPTDQIPAGYKEAFVDPSSTVLTIPDHNVHGNYEVVKA